MRIPKRLERLMVKWQLMEYVYHCKFSDNCCLDKHMPEAVDLPGLTPLEEVMACLDRTNEAIDRYLKTWDGQ